LGQPPGCSCARRSEGDAPPFNLQECVDLATFPVRTTIDTQRFIAGLRGVGGEIAVATITASEGLRWVQRKEPRGDAPLQWHDIGTSDGGVTDAPPDGIRPAIYEVASVAPGHNRASLVACGPGMSKRGADHDRV
jgi:hypothetical protein